MNAPFRPTTSQLGLADLADPHEVSRIEAFVAAHPQGEAFHRPAWLIGASAGTGNRALALTIERGGELCGYLPLIEIHSPLFGRVMASSGFGVGGGLLVDQPRLATKLFGALEELCLRRSVPAAELRGGLLPKSRPGWTIKRDSHCGFVLPLAASDEAQLNAILRKQRAEVRKGLAGDLTVSTGSDARHRAAHYAVYAQSVRNLGTPVFPRALFDQILNSFGDAADILVIWNDDQPVSAVLSLYHKDAVMPYWGGGTWEARRLRANDRMYYELMLHHVGGAVSGSTSGDRRLTAAPIISSAIGDSSQNPCPTGCGLRPARRCVMPIPPAASMPRGSSGGSGCRWRWPTGSGLTFPGVWDERRDPVPEPPDPVSAQSRGQDPIAPRAAAFGRSCPGPCCDLWR